jgi:Ca2+-binding RTX toxin-like protein
LRKLGNRLEIANFVAGMAGVLAAPSDQQVTEFRNFVVGQGAGLVSGLLADQTKRLVFSRLLAAPAAALLFPFGTSVIVGAGLTVLTGVALNLILEKFGNEFAEYLGDLWDRGGTGLLEQLRDNVRALWEGATNALVRIRTDPLVLDLDGDGVELIARESSNVFFDIDADGARESVGWVSADDGFLVLDRNGNGRIDDVNEMFGTLTQSGFTILSALDSNRDQFISSSDARFGDLRVWRDFNQNGESEANEIVSLSSLGITSIDLRAQDARFTSEGNLITFKSLYTRTNGQTGLIADVWLAFSNVTTASLTGAAARAAFADAPDLNAQGQLPTLRTRMTSDPGLAALARQAGAIRLETLADLPSVVERLLFRWAGTDNVLPTSRGAFFDARRLVFLETFMGTPYAVNGVLQDVPNAAAADALDRVWNKVWSEAAAAILIQSDTRFAEAGFGYNEVTGFSAGVGGAIAAVTAFEALVKTLATGAQPLVWALGVAALDRIAAQGFADERPAYEERLLEALTGAGLRNFVAALRNPQHMGGSAANVLHDDPDKLLIISGSAATNVTISTSRAGVVTGGGDDVVTFSGSAWGAGFYAQTGAGSDAIIGSGGEDVLDGGAGADVMEGLEGGDSYFVDHVDDVVLEREFGGVDTVFSSIDFVLSANLENLTLTGRAAINGKGNDGANILIGNDAANILEGGAGGDTYEVGLGDLVIERAGGGVDTMRSRESLRLVDNVENGQLLGDADVDLTGNTLNNRLVGNAGDNVLRGGLGRDELIGGKGDDTYVIDELDSVFEQAGEGLDRVFADTSLNLGDNLEIGVLTGTGDWSLRGGAGWNLLIGNVGDNLLDGAAGGDDMRGGMGDDVYVIDRLEDLVTEAADEGVDEIRLSVALFSGEVRNGQPSTSPYQLQNNVENANIRADARLFLGAEANFATRADVAVFNGNALANTFDLNGFVTQERRSSGSIDRFERTLTLTVNGGLGDDVYVVRPDQWSSSNTSPFIWNLVERAGEGMDTVIAHVNHVLARHIETLVLANVGTASEATGNDLNNRLVGNDWNNLLDGATGADTMLGGAGNDTYVVDNALDVIVDTSGIDTVRSAISWTLDDTIENLTLTGAAAINGQGNDRDNRLVGNAGRNVLTGGDGDDTYVIGLGDMVVERAGQGRDVIEADFTAALFEHVEVLRLTGTGDWSGFGNTGANQLFGNDGANYLDGGFGNDYMAGGKGDDIYVFDASDSIDERANEGFDTVLSSVSLSIGEHIERVFLTGSGNLEVTARGGDQYLRGNVADNEIDGGAGDDTMEGGRGDDTYVVSSLGDVVIERWNDGFDTVETELGAYTLGEGIERLVLSSWSGEQSGTGNALNNVLIGNNRANTLIGGAGDDTLDGAGGVDRLIGGIGDDTYRLDGVGDVVIENAGEGVDTIEANFSLILSASYANIENAVLTGSSDLNLQGNAGVNILIGNRAANNIDGLAGADVMMGGDGNDVYSVDEAGDRVIESVSGGTDTVRSTVTWALSNTVENLTLLGSANVDAYGNRGANVISGNAGANRIVGGLGADVMSGLGGRDVFVFSEFERVMDRITDFETGANGDVLDVSRLLRSIGYVGSNAIADQALRVTSGGTTTFIEVNLRHGQSQADWVGVIELSGVARANFIDASNLQMTAGANLAPRVLRQVGSATVDGGGQLLFQLDGDTFIDPEGGALTLRAELWDGQTLRALPSWLSFNPSQRLLFGTAGGGAFGGVIRITATDDRGSTAFTDLTLQVRRSTLGDIGGDGTAELLFASLNGGIARAGSGGLTQVGIGLPRSWTMLGRGDFNGDRKSDFAFRNTLTNAVAIWTMDGTTIASSNVLAGGLGRGAFLAIADFDKDRHADILSIRDNGVLDLWRFNAQGLASASVVVADDSVIAPRGLRFVGAGDVDGDGSADLVWRAASGGVAIWRMDSYTVKNQAVLDTAVAPDWNLLGLGDFDGDGRAELLWRNIDTGAVTTWKTNGLSISGSTSLPNLGLQWRFADIVDRNGDGRQDIVWRHVNGTVATWLMGASGFGSVIVEGAATGANLLFGESGEDNDPTRRLLADQDGDGRVDLLWRNASGAVARWRLNGTAAAAAGDLGAIPAEWRILGSADVSGDGKADLIWQNVSTGAVAGWIMDGNRQVSASILSNGLATGVTLQALADVDGDRQADLIWRENGGGVRIWKMSGGAIAQVTDGVAVPWGFDLLSAADFNGDGRAEILWRGPSNELLMWSMNGLSLGGVSNIGQVGQEWAHVASADFDGDGKADILWRNRETATLAFWKMDGGRQVSAQLVASPSDWRIDGVGDTDGDRRADLVWRNVGTGQVAVWRMNGANVLDAAILPGGAPPPSWQLVANQSLFTA